MTPGRLAGVFVLALLFPALGSAEPITGLVVFGDSHSDRANGSSPNGVLSPIPPITPLSGTAPNAPPWVEQLASKLGVPAPTSSLKGGLDYAYGSSQSSAGSGLTVPTLDTQVHSFLAGHTPESGQLFVVGGTGGLFTGKTDPATAAANVCGEINTLAHAGANHFLVFNLPQLGNPPSGAKVSAADWQALNTRIGTYNSCLAKDIDQLKSQWPGITVDSDTVAGLHKHKDPNTTGSSGPSGSSVSTAADTAPEPGSLSLAGLGALGLAAYGWRRRKLAA